MICALFFYLIFVSFVAYQKVSSVKNLPVSDPADSRQHQAVKISAMFENTAASGLEQTVLGSTNDDTLANANETYCKCF